MKSKIVVSVALIVTILAQESFSCEPPDPIAVPNGKTATEKEMVEGDRHLQQFMSGMLSYQECLNRDADQERLASTSSNKGQIKAQENKYASLHNKASDEMLKTAKKFDKAVEDYEARQ